MVDQNQNLIAGLQLANIKAIRAFVRKMFFEVSRPELDRLYSKDVRFFGSRNVFFNPTKDCLKKHVNVALSCGKHHKILMNFAAYSKPDTTFNEVRDGLLRAGTDDFITVEDSCRVIKWLMETMK